MVTSQKLGASVSNVVEVLADTPLLRLKKSVSLGLPFRMGVQGIISFHVTPFSKAVRLLESEDDIIPP